MGAIPRPVYGSQTTTMAPVRGQRQEATCLGGLIVDELKLRMTTLRFLGHADP